MNPPSPFGYLSVMGIFFNVEASPWRNLIGMRMQRRRDGSLRFTPTIHEFWQRVSVGVLVAALGGALLGFMCFLESRFPDPPPSGDAMAVLKGLQILGGLVIVWAVLGVLSWFRKGVSLAVDEHGDLALASRVWISRRETIPLANLQSIEYGVRQEAVGRIPVGEVNPSWPNKPAAIVWVWSVTLVFRPGSPDGEPNRERFDVASQSERPGSGDLPAEIVDLCTWLRDTTGKPVGAAGDADD